MIGKTSKPGVIAHTFDLRRKMLEDLCDFRGSLVYTGSSRTARRRENKERAKDNRKVRQLRK